MSNIPNLLDISNGRVSINRDFILFNEKKNWSPERQVEVFWHMVEKNIYHSLELSEERKNKALQAFTNAYELVKYKFQDIERNTGWRYFDHLIRVMQYVILNTKEPSIKKTLIAICHDLIEDTDIDFYTLKSIFGTYIALATVIISKEPIYVFLNAEDEKVLERIQEVWILNLKWIPSDEFLQRKSYNPESITSEELDAFQEYKALEEKYKNMRDENYFLHIHAQKWEEYKYKIDPRTPCMNKFFSHAISLLSGTHTPLKISYPEISQIIFDALEVKFWDRIDNLRTTEIYNEWSEKNLKKAERKTKETMKYFFAISKEFDMLRGTDFYNIMRKEVIKIQEYIIQKRIELTL